MRCFLEIATAEDLERSRFAPQHPSSEAAEDLPRHRPETPVRVLLRHRPTGRFFCSTDDWTDNAARARNFRNGWRATLAAIATRVPDLAIFYDFDDDRYNINIPLLEIPDVRPGPAAG
ncbi:MAG TPA: hypothetical protein VMQ67_06915 [Candidatus Saccharimonadales bacterium]|jgi:hypothetical protein|nr:hypothetical protein [Candidatus Saccharimonadales bacterium]